MRKAVSVIFTFENQIYMIKRQNYLPTFPGYHAFPGGLVDRKDEENQNFPEILRSFDPFQMNGLIREIQEEVNWDFVNGIKEGLVSNVFLQGLAVTPPFNPYRFETYFYRVDLAEKIDFSCDPGECELGQWKPIGEFVKDYFRGSILAVPPTVKILKELEKGLVNDTYLDLNLTYDPETTVPMIESLYGVKQFLPFSHTLPPAQITNSYLIGDEEGETFLIDPSPKDDKEMEKLYKALEPYKVSNIFITHHHSDHHERSTLLAENLNVPIHIGQDSKNRIEEKWGKDYFSKVETRIVKDGDILTKWLGEEIRVYEIPGHDEGHLGLAPKSLKWFIVGDLIQTIGTVVIAHPEGDMKKYFHTMEKVIALNPSFIFPSHGIGMGGTHKLSETLRHRKLREEQVLNLLEQGKSRQEMLDVIYEGIDSSLHPYALKTIDAHLRKLEIERPELKIPE